MSKQLRGRIHGEKIAKGRQQQGEEETYFQVDHLKT